MTGLEVPPSFRLGYVPGATPGKWARLWNERLPRVPLRLIEVTAARGADTVRASGVDAALLRFPFDRIGLHAIPLYLEKTVVVVPKDHVVVAVDEVSVADLADEIVLHPLDDTLDWDGPPGQPALERPATTGDAVELVAAGVGLLVVPQSLARLHHRGDLTYRPVIDAPRSRVALAWSEGETTELMEQFIGIVRGRTVNSSRGRRPEPATKKNKAKESERTKNGKPAKVRKPGKGKRSGGDRWR